MMATNIKQPSLYMRRKFAVDFSNPCGFWTGEDGMLVSAVIACVDDASEQLERFVRCYSREVFDASRIRQRWVERRYKEESNDFEGVRKLWYCTDEPTPFAVYEYELQIPY